MSAFFYTDFSVYFPISKSDKDKEESKGERELRRRGEIGKDNGEGEEGEEGKGEGKESVRRKGKRRKRGKRARNKGYKL